jgi:uncharacterized protein (TIGR02270 family)
VLALESGDMRRIEPLVARAEAEPEARRGIVGAIAWCRPALLAPTVRRWARSTGGFGRYLALCACSVHRAGGGSEAAARIGDADALVRGRALRLAGELGQVELLDPCMGRLNDDGEEAGFWAAWSAVLLGDRGVALQALKEIVLVDTPHRWVALEVAARAMGLELGAHFARALNGDARWRRALTVALGHLGDPAAAPWLIERMKAPELARFAGESFAMIAGADVEEDGLEQQSSLGAISEALKDDAAALADARDGDDTLPWPDQDAVTSWWRQRGGRFASGTRHLLGRPLDNASACEHAWREGSQRQRRAAAYESALQRPGGILPNWRAGNAGGIALYSARAQSVSPV